MIRRAAQRQQDTRAEYEKPDLRGRKRRNDGLTEDFPETARRVGDITRRRALGFDPAAEPRPTGVDFRSGAADVVHHAAFERQLVAATRAGRKMLFDLDPIGFIELTGRVPRKQLLRFLVRVTLEKARIRHRLAPTANPQSCPEWPASAAAGHGTCASSRCRRGSRRSRRSR